LSTAQRNRGTLHLEDARITEVSRFAGDQFIIRMQAPQSAAHADPGSFIHIQCDEQIPMRRPLSIMRASPEDGWIDVLFKTVGEGLRALGEKKPGEFASIIGPIGNGFQDSADKPNKLLIGGGVGIPPMIFLAERLRDTRPESRQLVIMGSEIPFPFELVKSSIESKWLPDDINSTMPLLEEWQIAARLASLSAFDGCYNGYVTDLSREWLGSLSDAELANTELFTCGPTPMLKAVASLAMEFDLPCQVSLEEFMACAVGGCAGCTVLVETDNGPAMRRVCVDGPVFDARSVFPHD
jgi:dihydroorotate dehydrogenase electron transfer subunit